MKKIINLFVMTLAAALLFINITVNAEGLSLSRTQATINVGETISLEASGAIPAWTSYNANIAKVDAIGNITGVRAGKTTVKAWTNQAYKTCAVTVVAASVKLDKANVIIYHGGTSTSTVKLKATIKGTSKTAEWTSSNTSVATVDSTGKVTSVGVGTAVITASANGKSASCRVIVKESSIKLDVGNLQLTTKGTGNSVQLTPAVVGSSKTVKWTTSDKTVAVVSAGKITGKKAGTATITAKANGLTAICDVIVEAGTGTISTASIDIIEDSVLLKTKGADKTYTLTTAIAGKNGTVKWKTSDASIVSVSKGKLTARKAGTATITATANGVSDTVNVTVENFDPTITLNNSVYTLYTKKGNTVTLKATVDGASKTVSWNSSNPFAASVSNAGKVTAVNEGITTITVTANSVSATCLVTVRASDIVLSDTAVSLNVGDKQTIYYDVIGANQTVTWATTNNKVATVSKGVVTAKKKGEADIKATANGVTSICHVVVGADTCTHVYDSGVITKEPSCAMTGIRKFTCTKCGDSYNEVVAVSEHNYTDTVTEPTCVDEGYMTRKCATCGDTQIVNKTNALGHSFGEWKTVSEPTEEKAGMKERGCSRCGYVEQEEIPVIGHVHSYVDAVTAPTCTEQGYTTHTCKECKDSYVDAYVDALGHDFGEWKVITEPTDTKTGMRERSCSRCKYIEQEEIPVIDHVHSYVDAVTAPTCTEQGYTTHTCSKCGNSYSSDYKAALGHDYKETVMAPTCTAVGYTIYVCTRCDDSYEDNFVAALGHNRDLVTTREATCTVNGERQYKCSNCNIVIETETIWPTGHKESEWIQEGSCDPNIPGGVKGTEYKKCTVCGEILDSHSINFTHQYENVTTKEATCTEDGEYVSKCKNCGYINSTHVHPKLDHEWSDWEVTKEPADGVHATTDDFGLRHRNCTRCGYVENQSIVTIDLGDDETKQMYGVLWEDEAYKTLDMVNELRESVGVGQLRWCDKFENIGKIRAAELGFMYSHYRPNGTKVSYRIDDDLEIKLGENIAMGCDSAESVFEAWKNSQGHYDNMVREGCLDYYCMCFVSYDGFGMKCYEWVQLFWGLNSTTPTAQVTSYSTQNHEVSVYDVTIETDVEENSVTEELSSAVTLYLRSFP